MRAAQVVRNTAETEIKLTLNLDGEGMSRIDSGIGFFDHMLTLFAAHGLFDLELDCDGDIHIDGHHSVEDIGIALGNAVKTALGEKKGIKRYGTSYVPMDEALAFVSLDISGRPYLVYDAGEMAPLIGDYDSELTEEFLRAFSVHAGITLHVKVPYGRNSHHKVEGIYKALGLALCDAVQIDERIQGVLSTKGIL